MDGRMPETLRPNHSKTAFLHTGVHIIFGGRLTIYRRFVACVVCTVVGCDPAGPYLFIDRFEIVHDTVYLMDHFEMVS